MTTRDIYLSLSDSPNGRTKRGWLMDNSHTTIIRSAVELVCWSGISQPPPYVYTYPNAIIIHICAVDRGRVQYGA